MSNVLEAFDKTGRKIFLTPERYKHILRHPEMQKKMEFILETLKNPLKIADYLLEKDIKYYYKYYKEHKSKAKYLRVIVKYLNGNGFIITAYFVRRIK